MKKILELSSYRFGILKNQGIGIADFLKFSRKEIFNLVICFLFKWKGPTLFWIVSYFKNWTIASAVCHLKSADIEKAYAEMKAKNVEFTTET